MREKRRRGQQRRSAPVPPGGGRRDHHGPGGTAVPAGLEVLLKELYLVGLGPGGAESMTAAALGALERADVPCFPGRRPIPPP